MKIIQIVMVAIALMFVVACAPTAPETQPEAPSEKAQPEVQPEAQPETQPVKQVEETETAAEVEVQDPEVQEIGEELDQMNLDEDLNVEEYDAIEQELQELEDLNLG